MVERYVISIDRKAHRPDKNLSARWENRAIARRERASGRTDERTRREIARDDETVQLWRGSRVYAAETDNWLNPPIYAISPGSVSTSTLPAIRGPIRGTSHAMQCDAMRCGERDRPRLPAGKDREAIRSDARLAWLLPVIPVGREPPLTLLTVEIGKKERDVSRDSLWNKQSNVDAQNKQMKPVSFISKSASGVCILIVCSVLRHEAHSWLRLICSTYSYGRYITVAYREAITLAVKHACDDIN